MYDIKSVSDIAKVSKTSVYNLIKKLEIKTFKQNGKSYINESDLNRIIAYYSIQQQETITDIIKTAEETQDNIQEDLQAKLKVETTDYIINFEKKISDLSNDFQEVKQVKNIVIAIERLREELQEKTDMIQSLIQENENIKNTELVGFMKYQIEEKDKTIQALIQSLNYDKQYQTAKLITENKHIVNGNAELPPEGKKRFFTRFFTKSKYNP